MQGIVDLFNAWWRKPFDPEGDVINWVLFLGFVIIVAIAWSRVIKQIV